MAAYGWVPEVIDDEVLALLLDLNLRRSSAPKQSQVKGLDEGRHEQDVAEFDALVVEEGPPDVVVTVRPPPVRER